MARLFVIIIVLSFVVAISSKFYFEHQIKNSLDQSAQAMSMVGEFTYQNVEVTHEGDIRIESLSFRPYNALEATTVDLIAVRPGSLLKLFQLEKDFRNQELPTDLGFSIHGVEMPVGGEYEKSYADSSQILNLGMSGCGYPAHIGFPGLKELGYSKVDMNMDVDYEIIGNGEHIKVSVNSFADGLTNMIVDFDLRLGAPSRQIAVIGLAMNNAELNSLRFKAEDFGFEKRLMEYCAKSAELPAEQYYDRHLLAWQNTWKNMDLQAGENFSQVYRNYIENPESFELNLYPTDKFRLKELTVTPPNILIYHLKGNIAANKSDALALDLTAFTGERPALQEEAAEAASTIPAEEEVSSIISPEELPSYFQKPIVLTLKNGKTYTGQAQSIKNNSVRFLRNLGGGQFLMPIKIEDIDSIELEQ